MKCETHVFYLYFKCNVNIFLLLAPCLSVYIHVHPWIVSLTRRTSDWSLSECIPTRPPMDRLLNPQILNENRLLLLAPYLSVYIHVHPWIVSITRRTSRWTPDWWGLNRSQSECTCIYLHVHFWIVSLTRRTSDRCVFICSCSLHFYMNILRTFVSLLAVCHFFCHNSLIFLFFLVSIYLCISARHCSSFLFLHIIVNSVKPILTLTRVTYNPKCIKKANK